MIPNLLPEGWPHQHTWSDWRPFPQSRLGWIIRECTRCSTSERAPGPPADDPYRDCVVYLNHGACVCSTGYPASCQNGDSPPPSPEGRAVEASEEFPLEGVRR